MNSARLRLVTGLNLLFVGLVPLAFGQNGGVTVQLPTIQSFSVNTSVLAPDRGAVSLGGVSRAYQSTSGRGVPGWGKVPGVGRGLGGRSITSGVGGGGSWARASIIDLQAMDEAVLAEAAARGAPTPMGSSARDRRVRFDPLAARVADVFDRQSATPSLAQGISADPVLVRYLHGIRAAEDGQREIARGDFQFVICNGGVDLRRKAEQRLLRLMNPRK